MPGYRCVMFWRSQNQGGNSCHQTRTTPTTTPRAKHPLIMLILSRYVESYQPHRPNSSCMGTAFSSSAAAHTSRCLSPRCGQLNASCAKFCKRCMKALSRSSRPGLTEESLFRKRRKSSGIRVKSKNYDEIRVPSWQYTAGICAFFVKTPNC